jgi:hypothetical protein
MVDAHELRFRGATCVDLLLFYIPVIGPIPIPIDMVAPVRPLQSPWVECDASTHHFTIISLSALSISGIYISYLVYILGAASVSSSHPRLVTSPSLSGRQPYVECNSSISLSRTIVAPQNGGMPVLVLLRAPFVLHQTWHRTG